MFTHKMYINSCFDYRYIVFHNFYPYNSYIIGNRENVYKLFIFIFYYYVMVYIICE